MPSVKEVIGNSASFFCSRKDSCTLLRQVSTEGRELKAENEKLYYGDNLDILKRYIKDESVDLIYLDPPFKSNQDYNVLFRERNGTQSSAQIRAFEDTWHWDRMAEDIYIEIVENLPRRIADLIRASRSFLGENDMMAYLVMMAIRLQELLEGKRIDYPIRARGTDATFRKAERYEQKGQQKEMEL